MLHCHCGNVPYPRMTSESAVGTVNGRENFDEIQIYRGKTLVKPRAVVRSVQSVISEYPVKFKSCKDYRNICHLRSILPRGKTLSAERKLVEELVRELASKNKIGFSLSGIRRIGKTSILREVERKLRKQGIPVVYVSMWQILPGTIDELARVLDRNALEAFEKNLPKRFKFEELLATGARALATLLSGLSLSAKVAEDLEISLSYVRRESGDVEEAVAKSISLIEHLAEMTKTRCVLVIDEFPSIVDLTYGGKNRKVGFACQG